MIRIMFSASKDAKDASSRTMLLGGTEGTVKEWEDIDAKVNRYPMLRQFSAIGSGASFREAMVEALCQATGQNVKPGDVTETKSSGGKYLSIRISVVVHTPEQVKAVFEKMKGNPGLKWCM